ncbi:hypothetical protein BJY00DRAFT_324928 [Aspergillus carlsbadensis]|nr:hypothetical protein BJY00DRAFT_324928 [Aspergillus carlsbadensis]
MSTDQSDSFVNVSYEEFAKCQIPLYHGPIVSIRIGAETYNVSKTLLCHHSPYFGVMFEGQFKEAADQSAELAEVPGVVSNRSFELLLQWLYLGRFILADESPTDRITAMIELARLADMAEIHDANMDAQIARFIQSTVLDNPPKDNNWRRSPNTNIHHITTEHIAAASHLPKGHPVRLLFARASIDAYLHSEDFRFSNEFHDVPEFAGDLLHELRGALESFKYGRGNSRTYHDPFLGKELPFRE